MGYQIKIIQAECISAGACLIDAPNTFGFDEEDKVIIINPRGDQDENILYAAQGCPADVIVLIDEETGAQVWPEDD